MYKILVAEDESIESMVLCKVLRKHLSDVCTVCEAKNGKEAWELFEQEHPEIAILDIEMPGVSGLEVARRIRESGRACILLFLTAFDRFDYAKQAVSVQALDYLLKPYEEKELLLLMEEAMRLYPLYASVLARKKLCGTKQEPMTIPEQEVCEEDVRLSMIREEMNGYIQARYADDISMQDAARAMNYSEAYFCKLFKQCFKVNFSAYLNEYRIARAKELLTDTRENVKEISLACGYSDANYFTRVFKRLTGITPSEYRYAHQK